MKAKYLIQIQTNNANMGVTGWFTIHGAMRKAAIYQPIYIGTLEPRQRTSKIVTNCYN